MLKYFPRPDGGAQPSAKGDSLVGQPKEPKSSSSAIYAENMALDGFPKGRLLEGYSNEGAIDGRSDPLKPA